MNVYHLLIVKTVLNLEDQLTHKYPVIQHGVNMKKFITLLLVLFISPVYAQCTHFVYGGVFPKTQEPHVLLCKKEFAVGYSTTRRTPIYVVQRLDAEDLTSPDVLTSATFRPDPALARELQAASSDFTNSGFDRGHLSPFEDNNHDLVAANESNYFTNVVPQVPGNNRGIWRVLESQIRDMSLNGPIFVVTGTIYDPSMAAFIGTGIPIPTFLYKVVINPRTNQSITWVVPNMSVASSELPNFVSTRQNVFRLSGVDPVPILTIQEIAR